MAEYCIICSKALTSNNMYFIPCSHVFHKECVKNWISQVGNLIKMFKIYFLCLGKGLS